MKSPIANAMSAFVIIVSFFTTTTSLAQYFHPLQSPAKGTNRFALIGDCGRPGITNDELRASVSQKKIRSLVLPGDNLYESTYAHTWDPWKLAGFLFDAVAIGNHNGGYAEEVAYFNMPGEYYSKVINGVRFIVLNSDNPWNVVSQMTWLNNALTNTQQSLTFLVYHHPTFPISDDHVWFEKPWFQLEMRQIFKDYQSKISAVVIGHDHISSFVDFGPIPAIVAGSGRSTRKTDPVSYKQDGFQIQTRYIESEKRHWGLLEIAADKKSATVDFIGVESQKSSCRGKLLNGKMLLDKNCAAGNQQDLF